MKKIVLSTLLLLLGINTAFAQEKLVDILSKLSVKDKVVKTRLVAEAPSYFELMESKQNFQIKEHKLNAWYINSYKNYSIYLMARLSHYTDKAYKEYYNPKIADYDDKQVLLFDSERQHCYMIKYGYDEDWTKKSRCFRVRSIDRYKKVGIESQFGGGINSIVRLDENLLPLYGTNIDLGTYVIEGIESKRNELMGLSEFKQCNCITYECLIRIPAISILEITDIELAKLFSDEYGYTDYHFGGWHKQDMQRLFDNRGTF